MSVTKECNRARTRLLIALTCDMFFAVKLIALVTLVIARLAHSPLVSGVLRADSLARYAAIVASC